MQRSRRRRLGIWWFHGLLAIVFGASIPYTKASHMLASYASMIVRDPPRRQAAAADHTRPAEDRPNTGLSPTSPPSTCSSSTPAPAAATSKSAALATRTLSPRDVVLELREQARAQPASRPDRWGLSAACSSSGTAGTARLQEWVFGEDGIRRTRSGRACRSRHLRGGVPVEIGDDHQPDAAPPARGRGELTQAADHRRAVGVARGPRSGRAGAAAAIGPPSFHSRSRTRARRRSTCSGSSVTTPRSTPAPSG